MSSTNDGSECSGRWLLRHAVSTLAYRGGKAISNVAPGVASFRAAESTRTPQEILSHIGDLLDWAIRLAAGEYQWKPNPCEEWKGEVDRFFAGLEELDRLLSSDAPLGYPAEKLFQGPIADALTHVGQIALLRRVAGDPIRGENYFKADIRVGKFDSETKSPRVEFD